MENLNAFLVKKLGRGRAIITFDIFLKLSEASVALNRNMTLGDVCDTFWDGQSDLILYYRVAC